MSAYSPTITVSPVPLLNVTTSDLTPYSEIQESQGSVMYEATNLYYQANSISQVNAPVLVARYNADGNLENKLQINPADPDQFQTVKNIDLKDTPIVFDGRTKIIVQLEPQEEVKLYFTTQQLEPSDVLEDKTNFFSDDFLKTYGFFQDYDEEIKADVDEVKDEFDNMVEQKNGI